VLVLSITSYITAQEHVIKYNKHEVNVWNETTQDYDLTKLGSVDNGGIVEVSEGYREIKIYYNDLTFTFIDLEVDKELSTDKMVVMSAKFRKSYDNTIIMITDHTTSFLAGDYLIQFYDLQ